MTQLSQGATISGTVATDSELPAAAVAGDSQTDTATTTVYARALLWDGTNWIRARGDVANGLDVDVTRSALPSGASTSAKQDTAQTAFDAIKTAVETLDNAVGGSELQVDVVGSLPAGSAAIGKLAANSGVDIGDVDVTSISAGTNVIGRIGHDTTTFGSSRKVVTTAGTRVTLASTTAAKWATITAETDNTGLIVVGSAAGVIASLSTREGVPLYAGDSITVLCDDLAEIGLDSTVSGDGVSYAYGA